MLKSKRCTKCGETKPASAFRPRPALKSGLTSWCRKCTNARCNATAPARREKTKKLLIELKGGRCQGCGGVFPHYVYDFHHRDPSQKEISMTDLQDKRWERVLAEAVKCDLLCANCHRIAHHGGLAGMP